MRYLVLGLGLLVCLRHNAQDKVYLSDGQKLEGVVTEINEEQVILVNSSLKRELNIGTVVLIEFKNGRTQVFKQVEKDLYLLNTSRQKKPPEPPTPKWQNECYINTLALYNADLSIYYEYRLRTRAIGLGILGTYNFNQYATLPNAFIGILSNGKKLYDAGALINFYLGNANTRHKVFFGGIVKYTAFNFTAVKEDSVSSGPNPSVLVDYEEASGSQLSLLINFGTHTNISESVFIKSTFALGFFALQGTYKEQLNFVLRNPETGVPANYSILPKASIGLCVGLKF